MAKIVYIVVKQWRDPIFGSFISENYRAFMDPKSADAYIETLPTLDHGVEYHYCIDVVELLKGDCYVQV